MYIQYVNVDDMLKAAVCLNSLKMNVPPLTSNIMYHRYGDWYSPQLMRTALTLDSGGGMVFLSLDCPCKKKKLTNL